MLLPLFMFLQSFLVSSISNTIRIKRFMGDVPRGTYAIALVVVRFIQTILLWRIWAYSDSISFGLPSQSSFGMERRKGEGLAICSKPFPKAVYMVRRKSSALWHES